MGRCLQRQGNARGPKQARLVHHQVTENDGYLFDDNIISSDTKQKTRAFKYFRQHYVDCIHKPQGWAVPNAFTNSHGNLDSSVRQWGVHSIRAYCSQNFCSLLLFANTRQAQQDALP